MFLGRDCETSDYKTKMKDIWIETEYGKVFGMADGPVNGRFILAIHGYSQRNGWHTWEPLMAPLAEAGFRIVSVDMPGWGQSTPTQGPVKGDGAARCALQILDGLAVEKAVLMGKSWGGNVAVVTAVTRPTLITHLILTAPALRDVEQAKQLTQPVLLAWAEDDPVIPFAYAARLAAAIPTYQLETYPTGGHSAAPNNAADFTPKAVRFLRE